VLPRLSELNTEPGSDTVTLRLLIRVVSRQLSEQSTAQSFTSSEEHAEVGAGDAIPMSVSDGMFDQVAALQHHMDSTDSATKRAVKDVARAIGEQQHYIYQHNLRIDITDGLTRSGVGHCRCKIL
jgi:hypothetical protein